MKARLALPLLTAVAIALTGCGDSRPAAPTPTASTSPLQVCVAGAGSATPVCVVASKRQVPPVMVADYDRKCTLKVNGKCKKYKNVFDEMEEKEPGYLQLCVTTPTGEVCEHTDQPTYDAYQAGQRYIGRVPA